MSLEYTEKAIITGTGRFRENDMWVRMLTPGRGALTGFAFGGCRSRRRFCGCLDALNTVLFSMKESARGEYLNLTEGTLIHSPRRLRHDPARLGMAVNCIKFAEAVPGGQEEAKALFDLVSQGLHSLETDEDVSPVFPLLFRARLAFEAGFGPDFSRCSQCGAVLERAVFSLEDGHALCPVCAARGGRRGVGLSPGALGVLESVRTLPPGRWSDLDLSPDVRTECSRVVDDFVRFHVGLAWERGAFRRV